jgi:hypothetical protein
MRRQTWLHTARRTLGVLTALITTAALLPTSAWAGRETDSAALGDRAVTVDGSAADWEGLPISYLPKTVRVLSLAHDADRLHVMFRFGDRRLARQIFHGGVTVWINGDAKAKDSFGVRYWGSFDIAQDVAPPRETDGEPLPEELRRRLGRPPQTDEIVLVRDDSTRSVRPDDVPGLLVASNLHEGGYAYEMAVPFDLIGGEVAERNPHRRRSIRIGIELGALPADEAEALRKANPAPGGIAGAPNAETAMNPGAPATESMRSDAVSAPGPVGAQGAPAGAAGRWLPSVDDSVDWLKVTLPGVAE